MPHVSLVVTGTTKPKHFVTESPSPPSIGKSTPPESTAMFTPPVTPFVGEESKGKKLASSYCSSSILEKIAPMVTN